MATVTLTPLYGNLVRWPGHLFEATPDVTITTHTATNFTFRFPSAGVDFPNYQIVITGTGFAYDGFVPLEGDVASVQVRNGLGQVVLTISGINASAMANDLSLLYQDMFGSPGHNQGGDGPGPWGMAAWSHLLSGNDTINGSTGNDGWSLPGTNTGNDVTNMGAGNDWAQGGIGNDTINGGDGGDTLSYQQSAYEAGFTAIRGATINVDSGTALDPWGYTDEFTGFEMFEGSIFNDRFNGSITNRDYFRGGRGADIIDGGDISFRDNSVTADRKDFVSYAGDTWEGGIRGIRVDLETSFTGGSVRGTIRDGFGNTDTVIDIERVEGTRFNDVFVGSRFDNVFAGGEGRDSYDGDGGSDIVRLGASFADDTQTGVEVNLGLSTGQIINDGFGNSEDALRIENLEGTHLADKLRGNAGANYLEGGQGADSLTGAAGADEFYWDGLYQVDAIDRITDFDTTGADKDHLSFNAGGFAGMTGTVVLVNGNAATAAVGTFVFRAANNTLYWDEDGTGSTAMVAIVVLNNVTALTVDSIWV